MFSDMPNKYNVPYKGLTVKLLKQVYIINTIKLNSYLAFSKFNHSHTELIVEYKIGSKTLLRLGISYNILW